MREVIDESTGISNQVSSSTGAADRAARTCSPRIAIKRQGRQDHHARQRAGSPLLAAGRRHSLGRRTARRSMPATCSRVSRANAPRPATSPAVCRAWPSCSKPASPRISRSSRDIEGRVEFGKDYKNKRRIIDRAEGRGRRAGRIPDPEGQAHPFRKATSCRRATS